MIRNAVAAALVAYVIITGVVLKECIFLAPYRSVIWEIYGPTAMAVSGVLILNLFAAFYVALRKLALKDTGDKLAHLERQLRGSGTVSQELTDRILERK